jgi:hypothetical protein
MELGPTGLEPRTCDAGAEAGTGTSMGLHGCVAPAGSATTAGAAPEDDVVRQSTSGPVYVSVLISAAALGC